MKPESTPEPLLSPKRKVGILGIGNTLAGDDGAGIVAARLLEQVCPRDPRLLFDVLEGDLYAISEFLPQVERFVFLDSVAGSTPGHIVILRDQPRGWAPSFHQTSVASVMNGFQALNFVSPFPDWEIWGVTIHTPRNFRVGLSPVVEKAVVEMVERLKRHLECSILH